MEKNKKTILQELNEKIAKAEQATMVIDKTILGDGSEVGLSMQNPIHIAEVLRLKTIKLGIIGKVKSECYRASKLYKVINDVEFSRLSIRLKEELPEETATSIKHQVKVKMNDDMLDQVETDYLVDYYTLSYAALDKNIDALKYKFQAFRSK